MVNYWWVSQNKTFEHEVGGGYLWSPISSNAGTRIAAYDFMTEIQQGDIIFSFAGTYIRALGIALGPAKEAEKPRVFGKSGETWASIGWRVPVDFTRVTVPIRPANHMQILRPLLPGKYSPIRPDGEGNQQYLFPLPEPMAEALLDLVGRPELPAPETIMSSLDQLAMNAQDDEVVIQPDIPETEKAQLVLARRGQGLFRNRVRAVEPWCRVTHVASEKLLVASHIKPWKSSDNQERLDGNNGLFLSPHIDKLFDGGFISFTDNGRILVSPKLDTDVLPRWSIDQNNNVGRFNPSQAYFLGFHRDVLLR